MAVGVCVVDDYAVTNDSFYHQRAIAIAAVDLALGREPVPFADPVNRTYGAAFEALPLFVERLAGLDDSRSIHLTRHLMTHLFFIVGGMFGYLLAYRMTGSRLLGLFAMLLFLLHPRLYGHSFFNTKDIPFLSMLMIALCCVHWALRRGTVGAFLVCGVAVGILCNLRIMGAMLLPAVLAMRGCDWYYAAGGAERRRAAASGAAFALAALAAYYASFPYLWSDPISRFGERCWQRRPSIRGGRTSYFRAATLARQTCRRSTCRSGLRSRRRRPRCCWPASGSVAVLGRAIADVYSRGGAVLRNSELRFELLLAGGAALPIAAAIVLEPVLYNGWRQLYYLWAPLCLLAAVGLQRVGIGWSALIRRVGRRRPPLSTRLGLAGLAGLAAVILAVSAVQMLRLHPYQHLYFNLLVDRATPEYLKNRYEMDYYFTARRESLNYVLDHHPDADIFLAFADPNQLAAFPAAQRRRIKPAMEMEADADYYLLHSEDAAVYPPGLPAVMLPPTIYARQVYNNTIMRVVTPDLAQFDAATADAYRAIYRSATAQEPALRNWFDIYLNESEKTLTLVNEDCRPGALRGGFLLRIYPAAAGDLPGPYRYQRQGYVDALLYGVRLDGKCLMRATLPNYDLARIIVNGVGEILSDDYLAEVRRQYAALQAVEPIIRSDFAVYLENDQLRYIRDECIRDDTAAPFFLHIVPADANDLPKERREHGFDNRDFDWNYLLHRGQVIAFDDKCMVTVELPDYEIHIIHTGQYAPGEGRLWSGEFYKDAYFAAQADQYAARAVGQPAASGFFNVYHSDGDADLYPRGLPGGGYGRGVLPASGASRCVQPAGGAAGIRV